MLYNCITMLNMEFERNSDEHVERQCHKIVLK